jgi:hypothetical protein
MAKPKFENINDVMNHIQTELKAPKNLVNKFGGFKYRNLESIVESLKPIMKEIGNCYVTMSDEIEPDHLGMDGSYLYVKSTVAFHWKNERIETKGCAGISMNKKGMDTAQVTGSASSYARKYAMNGLFAIDDSVQEAIMEIDAQNGASNNNKKATIGG